MDDFDLTQPMSLCYDDDDPVDETNDVAILKVPLQNGIPKELEFSLRNGVNKIGRSESCEVCIKSKVLSKEHAVIEVGADCFLIYDLNSSNKTWKGKKPLKPNVKYKLEPHDEVAFGNIKAQFLVKNEEVDEAADSGSETGSESMLLLNEEYCAFTESTPIKNIDANEVGTDALGNASTSKALFPKDLSPAEEKKTESLKEAAVGLDNAPTQQFNGVDFCDSDAETDCEDHSTENTVTKKKVAPHSESMSGPQCAEGTVKKKPTNIETGITNIVDHDGSESCKGPGSESDEKIINVQFSENSLNKYQKLPKCQSLDDSSDDLPPTQINLDLLKYHNSDVSEGVTMKEQNSKYGGKFLQSYDSLPETQVNTELFHANLEIPESPQRETDDDLPSIQCVSKHVENGIGNIGNKVLKHKVAAAASAEESQNSDDLPPTQLNLALQFSQEQNFLQRDDSQSSYGNNALSPKPSTSAGINNSRTAATHFSSSRKRLNVPHGGDFEESIANKSRIPLLSCVNISVEEGSPLGDATSVLCPSTQRRSGGCDYKIKNTDIHCSPILSKGSCENAKDSIAETPPHLLKESDVTSDLSSVFTSLSTRLTEMSPIALQNFASTSNSPTKNSDDVRTPGKHSKSQPKASTPDSAKAGELNYSVNCSPKVYKKKLGDMDKNSQEISQLEQNDKEATISVIPKSKEAEHTIVTNISANEVGLSPVNYDGLHGSVKKQSRTNRKRKAAVRKANNGAKVARNTLPDSDTDLKTKESRTPKPVDDIKSPNSSSHHHNESNNLNSVPQKQRTERGNVIPVKHVDSELGVSKMLVETVDEDKMEEQSTAKPEAGKSNLEDSSVSSADTSSLKSGTNKRAARKKKPENRQNTEQLPSRRSKRQKCVSDKKSAENGDIREDVIFSNVTRDVSGIVSKNDFAAPPVRKSVRRKLLHFEPDSDMPNTSQEIGFSVFRKSEALEVEKDSLLDTRLSKRRKVNPVESAHEKNAYLVKNQSDKHNPLSLNESEVSISSGEHCNIVIQDCSSDNAKNQNSYVGAEGDSCGCISPNVRKRGAHVLCHVPTCPVAHHKTKKMGKSEIQGDSVGESTKNDMQSSSSKSLVKAEESPLKGKKNHLQRKSPRSRLSHKQEMPDTTSTEDPLVSKTSLDTSSKTENEDGMLNKSKKNSGRRQALGSRQSHKEKVVLNSTGNTEDMSLLSMESSSRSLRLRLSASDTSTDESPCVSEKCQISVFAKDSVESLVKLDTQNPGLNQKSEFSKKEEDVSKKEKANVSVQKRRRGRQSQSKFSMKEEEEEGDVSKKVGEDSGVSLQSVKKGRQSRSKINLKEEEEVEEEDPKKDDNNRDVSVRAVKTGRQSRLRLNMKKEEEIGSKKDDNKSDDSVRAVKTGRQSRSRHKLKEEEEDVSKKEDDDDDVSVQGVKKSRQSRTKLNDNLSSPPSAKKNKRPQNSNLLDLSDSICETDETPSKNKKARTTKNMTFTSPSSRSQQQYKPKVMFTMVENEEPQKVVTSLGGKVVEDVNICTHLVAEKLRRTVKALCCIGKGIPLVNVKWIQECKKSESFVDHVPFLIKDKAAEKQYQFELQNTLQKAAEKPLLSSWSVHVTPKVVPSPEQMKDIIQCAGGKYLPKMPNRLSEKTVVITCAADLRLCSHAMKCGIPVVGSEFILTGLLQYKIDTKSYLLGKN